MSVIIGLNAYHADSAACIMVDGRLVAAAEEERFRRIKHWAGFPSQALAYCLDAAGCDLRDVSHLALNSNPRAAALHKAAFVVRSRPSPRLIVDRLRNAQRRAGVAHELRSAFPDQPFAGRIHRVEHHEAHLASAFHVSPFERATVVSVDGFGDFASGAWGSAGDGRIDVQGRVHFPHSLGIFYQALTQYLGFTNYGDEYKVMGLAPYGEPRFVEPLRRVLRTGADGLYALDLSYFRHARERIDYRWSGGSPEVGTLFTSALEDVLGPARAPDDLLEDRHRDIARSVQVAYEEAFFGLLGRLHAAHGLDSLCIAGGCGMNSVANGKVRLRTPFKHVYVQPAAGDAGGAIGAAFSVAREVELSVPPGQMPHAYWGPAASDPSVRALLSAREADLRRDGCEIHAQANEAQLCATVAEAIAAGAVVGWFQGRMEWGPRALGNRSILCDPRRTDAQALLNGKIKRRESFRPFAPSILEEFTSEWFEQSDPVPFMMQVYQVRESKRGLIPAVTHVDGSGRLQTVSRSHAPRYHALLRAFEAITGVPMLLNTSFNENEPIVCRPEEALDCFLRTKMDVLVLGSHMLRRDPAASRATAQA